jgi:hypothetical protein
MSKIEVDRELVETQLRIIELEDRQRKIGAQAEHLKEQNDKILVELAQAKQALRHMLAN